ncbi:MAG TPA: hypothetical protein VNB64_08735 [Solirubrobacteraceae bacterium]|nr:hypothetical protein [Solirubrobacteraceae bacterium]
MRARLAALAALAALAGCGDSRAAVEPTATAAPVMRFEVGEGARGGVVLRPARPGRLPVVVFLHGYQAIDPENFAAWLDHLARRGNVVVYPRYQDPDTAPARFLGNALPAIRAGLALTPVDRGSLVVAGHSAGGALSSDYAAIAAAARLPRPVAVFAAQPGRYLGIPQRIPRVDPRRIDPRTRLLVLAGDDDGVVGTAEARRAVRLATRVPASRRRFVLVRHPEADDHGSPLRTDAAARRFYWAPLDRLLADVRRWRPGSSASTRR